MLERLDFLTVVQSDDFRAAAPLRPQDELDEAAFAVYEVIKMRGGVASRAKIREALIGSGRFLEVTVVLVVDNSPILTRIRQGVCSLIGWPLIAAALSRAVNAVGGGKETEVTHYPDGRLLFSFVLSEFAARAKGCALPAAAVSSVPAGKYRVEGSDHSIDCVHVNPARVR